MNIDKPIQDIIRQEIDRIETINAEMRKQMEQEINRNQIHIYALKELLKRGDDEKKEYE